MSQFTNVFVGMEDLIIFAVDLLSTNTSFWLRHTVLIRKFVNSPSSYWIAYPNSNYRVAGEIYIFAGIKDPINPIGQTGYISRHEILGGHKVIHPDYWKNHPDYKKKPLKDKHTKVEVPHNYNSDHNDIALVAVYPPFNLNDKAISKISPTSKIPKGMKHITVKKYVAWLFFFIQVGKVCEMAGWGQAGTLLKEAKVKIWDQKDCEKAWTENKPFQRKFTHLLCAGKEETAEKVWCACWGNYFIVV